VTHSPEIGAGATLVVVTVAALEFGLLKVIYSLLHIFTGIPFSFRYRFASGMDISPKWKIEAARTAAALPIVTAS
jgi:hypothetical protein